MHDSPPDAPSSYERPNVPYCLSDYSYTGRHTCDGWEIDSFLDDLNNYIQKLNDYVESANEFARSAARFADSALDYAECEAKDAKEAIE